LLDVGWLDCAFSSCFETGQHFICSQQPWQFLAWEAERPSMSHRWSAIARDSGATNKASASVIAMLNGKSFTEAFYRKNFLLASVAANCLPAIK
jgi:hypothetical protein